MSKTIKVGHELFAGQWHAWFSVGHQKFHVSPIRSEEGENGARWQAEMLRSAFDIPRIGDVPTDRQLYDQAMADVTPEALERMNRKMQAIDEKALRASLTDKTKA